MNNVDVLNLTERCKDLSDLRAFCITPWALKTVRGERKTADSGMTNCEPKWRAAADEDGHYRFAVAL
jgi:hypothetical protein